MSKKSSFNFKPKPKTWNNPILRLQKTVGNQAVNRILSAGISTNTRLSKQSDDSELEAERISSHVVRGLPKNKIKKFMNAKRNKTKTNKPNSKQLDPKTRFFMEAQFGRDFSFVNIHSDNEANKIANTFNARAFTLGKDIFFRRGLYSPHTYEGRKLIAHELTHVTQEKKFTQTIGPNPLSINSNLRKGGIHRGKGKRGDEKPLLEEAEPSSSRKESKKEKGKKFWKKAVTAVKENGPGTVAGGVLEWVAANLVPFGDLAILYFQFEKTEKKLRDIVNEFEKNDRNSDAHIAAFNAWQDHMSNSKWKGAINFIKSALKIFVPFSGYITAPIAIGMKIGVKSIIKKSKKYSQIP